MLAFFRINVVDRLAFLLVLALLFGLPAFIIGIAPTIPQEIATQVGNRLASGNWLYSQCHTETGPLSALIYAALSYTKEFRDTFALTLAWIFILLQSYIFNALALRYEIFSEKNYLPGLIYLILGLSCFPFLILSDISLGSTFIVLALIRIIKHLRIPIAEDEILYIGSLIGLATLCFTTLTLFLILPILSFALYTGTTIRQYFLLLIGFAIPTTLVGLIFYMTGHYTDYYNDYIISAFTLPTTYLVSIETHGLFIILPTIMLIAAIFTVINKKRYINFQVTVQVTLLIAFIIGLLVIILSPIRSLLILEILILPIAYYITHLFYSIKRQWLAEIILLFWIALSLSLNYAMLYYAPTGVAPFTLNELYLNPEATGNLPTKILVFDIDYSSYHNRTLATPYLNTHLSKRYLTQMDDYRAVLKVYNNFSQDWPQTIIAKDTTLTQLFNRIPALERHYSLTNAKLGIYEFKK